MSDPEPSASDGQPEPDLTENGGGSLSRLRTLLRLWRRPRGRIGPRERTDSLIAVAALDSVTPITAQERFLIGNILKVHDRNAADVMTPRVDIVALDVEQPFAEIVKCMVEQGHSRVPVYRQSLDDVIGFIHVKDVLAPVADRRPGSKVTRLLRKVLYVAPSVPILDLLVQMRQARTHIAMVVDEFGGIDGLVTIEDLIEEIVGEIEDEHDDAEPPTLIERPDGSIIADARLPIEALEEQQGTRLRPEGEEEVDTLGGLVFMLAGRVPKRGEIIVHPDGIEFEVLDADPRRVKRLRVRGLPGTAAGKGAASA